MGQRSPVSGGRRQVDSVPEVQQDAVAAVELSVAAVADELGQTGVCVHGHSEQLLEVCAEERVDGAGLALQLRKRLPQTPRGELPVTQPTEARAHPACQRSEVREALKIIRARQNFKCLYNTIVLVGFSLKLNYSLRNYFI